LILRKINNIAATRCHILKLKCTKFDFGFGELTALPRPLAVFKGPTSKGSGGEVGDRGKGGEGREREGKESEGRRPCRIHFLATVSHANRWPLD